MKRDRPAVGGPADGTLDKDGGTILSDAITVADKDVATIDMVDSTMARSLIRLFVAFEEKITTTIAHIHALAVEIRPVNRLTSAYSNAVVALTALATIIP